MIPKGSSEHALRAWNCDSYWTTGNRQDNSCSRSCYVWSEERRKRLGWCTANAATDLDLINEIYGSKFCFNESPKLSASRLEEDFIYVLDEAQEIHRRHAESIKSMVQNASQATILVITRTPSIFSTIPSATRYPLEGVDIEAASKYPHLEKKRATQIAIALGGAPSGNGDVEGGR